MKLSVSSKIPVSKAGTAIVLGVTGTKEKLTLLPHLADTKALDGLDLTALGASAKLETLIRIPAANGGVFALIGAGQEELDEDSLRELGAAAIRKLDGFKEIIFDLPSDDERDAVCTLEGALLGGYKYVATKPGEKSKLNSITVLSSHKVSKQTIERSQILAHSVNRVRDLVNTPPNVLYPQSFAAIVSEEAESHDVSVTVLDEKALKAGKYGGILAVGQGSARPPRLVKIEYTPKKAKQHLALVGKGITFDTGGISIKPAASMVGMKYDMTGAATVYQAILAISALKLPIKVTSYLCLAENMPSGSATRPSSARTTIP